MTENLPDTNVGNIEYIRKQDAVDALAKTMPTLTTPDGAGEFDHEIHIADEAFADAIRIVESIEPADVVQVRHGRWKYRGVCGIKNNITIRRYKCSECREDIVCDCPYNFCPYCGAKMDGKGEE